MAISKVLRTTAKTMGGILLSLMGGWLGVVCIGGVLTLGVLSLFHIGVLLSLGCIGVCLLMVGACVLYQILSKATSLPPSIEDQIFATEPKENSFLESSLSSRTQYTTPFYADCHRKKLTGDKKSLTTDEAISGRKTPSLNPFDE